MRTRFEGLSEDSEWYRLDNAATGFGIITDKRYTEVYRLAVTLREPINLTRLQTALTNILPRFPYFRVNLKTGFFWHFWETNLSLPAFEKESRFPNAYFNITAPGSFLFKIKIYYSRIALEVHHCLTDGTGALVFFKALLGEYLHLHGILAPDWLDVLRPGTEPLAENILRSECEDSYKKLSTKIEPVKLPDPPWAFRLPFKKMRPGNYYVTTGLLSVKEVMARVKEYKVSLTDFIIAVYMDALQQVQQLLKGNKKQRPIRLAVPVNLRQLFPSQTMRNFFLCVEPEINPSLGNYTFTEILAQVHHQLREKMSQKYLNQLMYKNVQSQWHPFNRSVPLFLKKIIVKRIHRREEVLYYSGMLSNLGLIQLPESFASQIDFFQFVPTPTFAKVGAGVISYGDRLSITFGRIIKEPYVEQIFFKKLTDLGFAVKIQTNY